MVEVSEKPNTQDDGVSKQENRNPASSSSSTSDKEKVAKKGNSDATKSSTPEDLDAQLAHLPEHEREILKQQLFIPDVKATYGTLFRYATRNDMIFLAIVSLASIAAGAALPLFTVLFGSLAGTFRDIALHRITYDEFNSILTRNSLYFVYLGIAQFILLYVSTVGFIYVGEHITQKIRAKYLHAILRQNIGFFDKLGAGEVTTRITADTNLIQDGISEKVGLTLTALSTFFSAFIIGYVRYWKLALICSSTIVAMILVMGGISRFVVKSGRMTLVSYGEGGTVAEEVISSIRNATAFGTQEKLARQYEVHLKEARKWGRRLQMMLGIMFGSMMAIMYSNYGLGFWMGSRFLVGGETDLSAIVNILLAIVIGSFSIGNVAPNTQAFASAISAGAKIFSTIDRVSAIDPGSDEGDTIENVEGTIEFRLIGSPMENESEEQIKERIVSAAKEANAHDFIMGLPDGYATDVGQRGFLLSGGQKQRIAIARAIVSDPKILLLDEATSALDTKSEGVVQAALDAASRGRTTIVIAHRLSTIKSADNIVVIVGGRIAEQGTHDELVDKKGTYLQLVEAQKINEERGEESEDEAVLEKEKEISRQISVPAKSVNSGKYPDEDVEANLGRIDTKKSLSSVILSQKRSQENETEYSLGTLIRFIAGFNKPERLIMLCGFFFAVLSGAGQPVQSVFFAKGITTLSLPPSLYGKLREDANFWSLMFLMLGLVQLVTQSAQGVIFAICSESLIYRARSKSFRAMLRQDIAFFDLPENSTGALTSFLSTETKHLSGVSGATLGTILMVSTTLIVALTVALAFGWKLALVCISTVPVLLLCGFYRFWILAQFQTRAKKAYESSASYACEATSSIRTVASLTREQGVMEIYEGQLNDQAKKSLRSVAKSSLLYAASQSFSFFCLALGFWYGGGLLGKGEYNAFQFFLCISCVIFGSQSAGIVFSFSPDMGKAKSAAADFKRLFDRVPTIDIESPDGEKLETVEGTIEFRDVHFRYPTRPEQPVLRGLNLTVKPGQYIALVGPSGCGKSTTIALVERFYDTLSGGVYIDGKDISRLNVNSYRSHLALVSQEPTLYQGTIRDNVLLGVDRDELPDEQVFAACKAANIYDFIMSLPDGFGTVVGSKGSMLSGGQKQRIAIARALIRDPKVLLLDEATSALDSESEKVVQAALDAAAKGRTTIAVAHRLSTIQKADIIYVFDQGRIVESGTHHELLQNKGRYYELVHMQSLEKTQ
ncbi:ABC multidrug transporter mdr1 [Trichophyton equinum CBS 127.97]|nr:ABC multidrug transporter mdr1 [Trichophyton equinum CBS 127.97]